MFALLFKYYDREDKREYSSLHHTLKFETIEKAEEALKIVVEYTKRNIYETSLSYGNYFELVDAIGADTIVAKNIAKLDFVNKADMREIIIDGIHHNMDCLHTGGWCNSTENVSVEIVNTNHFALLGSY